jgi:hypothetical protein
MILTPDTWSLVLQQVQCTRCLLRLRLVNKVFRDQIPLEKVTGIPARTAQVLFNPKTTKYGKLTVSESEDVEGELINDGVEFWSWVNANPLRLTQYEIKDDSCKHDSLAYKRTITFLATNTEESFLWIKVNTGGLICTLTTSM